MRLNCVSRVNALTIALSAILLSSAALGQAQTQPERYYYGPHMMGWGGGWYGMIIGPLMMLIVLGAVIALVALAVSWVGASWRNASHAAAAEANPPGGRKALEILNERFARGEIDKTEFEERKRVLES
jgi:putative membrane protein